MSFNPLLQKTRSGKIIRRFNPATIPGRWFTCRSRGHHTRCHLPLLLGQGVSTVSIGLSRSRALPVSLCLACGLHCSRLRLTRKLVCVLASCMSLVAPLAPQFRVHRKLRVQLNQCRFGKYRTEGLAARLCSRELITDPGPPGGCPCTLNCSINVRSYSGHVRR